MATHEVTFPITDPQEIAARKASDTGPPAMWTAVWPASWRPWASDTKVR